MYHSLGFFGTFYKVSGKERDPLGTSTGGCQAGEATGLQSHKVAELHRSSAAAKRSARGCTELGNAAGGKGLLALPLQLFPVGNWV